MAVNKRLALVSVLAVLIAAGGGGLALVLGQSHVRDEAQLRHAAEDRAGLAAALIDSVFAGSYDAVAPSRGPVSRARVTREEILATRRHAPLTVVIGARGAILASHPAIGPAMRRLIAAQPALTAALADGRHHLSSLLGATAGTPAGFLDVAPFTTGYGRRATVTWLPLATVGPVLHRYLRYVASYTEREGQAQVFLLDAHDMVVASADGESTGRGLGDRALPGRGLRDRALRTALEREASGSRFGPDGSRFFAATRLTVAPWTVVYATRTASLMASQGSSWRLSLLLLGGFLAAATVCLALLIGLLSSSGKLARANAALELRNDQLKVATEAKSRFVANMAHELRTPLNAVLGFSELMQAGRAGDMNDAQTEYLGIVRSSADHLLLLINESLDLAAVEAGQLTLRPESLRPAVIARECVIALRAVADVQDVSVVLETGDLGRVSLDPGRLRQVILNLLSNAIKFSHPGGRVTVRLAREDGRLTIAVSDEGPGIAAIDQERVFDEFVQLGHRASAGSGLGLAVTRQIVQAQGGEVTVVSQVGAGSTFIARLPWVSPETQPEAGSETPGRGGVAEERWREVVAGLAPHAGPEAGEPAQDDAEWSRAWRSRPRIPSSHRSG